MTKPILKLLTLAAIIATLLHPSVALAANIVGAVSDVEGTVTVVSAGGKEPHALHRNDGIAVNDTISTGRKSRVNVVFSDQTKLSMEENGTLTIDKFIYDPKQPEEGKGLFTILGGAFTYVSGLMDKGRRPDVTLQLETGALGIRGTQLMGAMRGAGKDSERWIYLKSGKISVYNAAGAVTLNPGEGTIMKSKQQAPAKPHIWKARELLWIKSQVTGHDIQW
jgi:hypothetical protein